MLRAKILIPLAFLLSVCAIGFGIGEYREQTRTYRVTVQPDSSDEVLRNPFIGWAPSAVNGPYRYDHRLVYKVITWRDLEPEKGQFAFEELERKYEFEEWRLRGVSIILRFVMDYPDGDKNMDIPDWLYYEIGGDGIWFDEDIGYGFSPSYVNPKLIEFHRLAVKALGERYDNDPRVAFIALGSLGHWGEWHTVSNERVHIPFPEVSVSDRYVRHYLDAFTRKKLLLRRPYPIAKENGIGLYNDVFGFPESTGYFVDWFKNGYFSLLAGEVNLPAMPDFWKAAPSGGEFGSTDDVRDYFRDDKIDSMLKMVEESHVSWLGLTISSDTELSDEVRRNMDKMLKKMGYRLQIRSVSMPETIVVGRTAEIDITIDNTGVAPFYYDWPVELTLTDETGVQSFKQRYSDKITHWVPGSTQVKFSLSIPEDLAAGVHRLRISVIDPATDQPAVDFANEGRQSDGRFELGKLNIRKKTIYDVLQEWFEG